MSVVTETQRIRTGRNSWQSSLTSEIISLEDNLDRLYDIVGLKSHRIVQLDEADQLINLNNNNDKDKTKETPDYQDVIQDHLEKVKQAAINICSLINSVTQFDLPIPVYVLLKLATRIASIRWSDFDKKITGTLSKRHVYSKSSELISISVMMYKWISHPLGTNIISFQPFINQNLLNILEWTRCSGLAKHNEAQYLGIRCQIFKLISDAIDHLSLNLNLNPKQLQTLINTELVESLQEQCINVPCVRMSCEPMNGTPNGVSNRKDEDQLTIVKDKYLSEALSCLEKLYLVYGDYLDAKLDHLLRTYVIQTCMKIYRDFEKNVIGLAGRRQLLRLLETIASRPYATSTTELAWHLLEMADSMETDTDIKMFARRSLKVGLAHRPVLVSHHDVYNCHIRPMTSASGEDGGGEETATMLADKQASEEDEEEEEEEADDGNEEKKADDKQAAVAAEESDHQVEVYLPAVSSTPDEAEPMESTNIQQDEQNRDEKANEQQEQQQHQPPQPQQEPEQKQVQQPPQVQEETRHEEKASGQDGQQVGDGQHQGDEDKPEDDPEVQSCMSLFVSKPAR